MMKGRCGREFLLKVLGGRFQENRCIKELFNQDTFSFKYAMHDKMHLQNQILRGIYSLKN